MEKIKVNMSPNPLDVQTIHASQNDGEARQWEFELHNNGELIDTSDVKEQLVFKAYKGGTEQLLPENGSTPTTSPFKGDIRYPQGLLTDQEFTYRESPTEEDGLAKITDIKGNTLNWNQQLHLLSSTYWVQNNASVVFADGVGTFTATGATFGCYVRSGHRFAKTGHKYLFSVEVTSSQSGNVNFGLQNAPSQQNVVANTKTRLQSIVEATTDNTNVICYKTGAAEGDTLVVSNFFAIDLTQMGLDITDPSDFTSLFNLPYYAYNQGSLLSFNGNGIKTVGKNLIKPYPRSATLSGVDYTFTEDGTLTAIGTATSTSTQFVLNGDNKFKNIVRGAYYFLSGGNDKIRLRITTFDSNGNVVRRSNTSTTSGNLRFMFNDEEVEFYISASAISTGVNINSTLYPQLELSYDKTSFEPYTESVLSLPVSTYFPNGMDGVGTAYDELTNSGYVKKLARVTFDGTKSIESIVTIGSYTRFTIANGLSNVKYPNAQQRSNYLPYVVSFSEESSHFYMNGSTVIIIMPTSLIGSTRETANAYLQSNPLTIAYELQTPLENYGVLDLGTITYTYDGECFIGRLPSDAKVFGANTETLNSVSDRYLINNWSSVKYLKSNMTLGTGVNRYICIFNSSYTDATAFKTAMSGVYLYYELATPTETSFTTASLVTENAEIPLSNEDGTLIGKCTEELSAEPGFHDAKIKLSDSDGECYSNKIQLHIERSPQ